MKAEEENRIISYDEAVEALERYVDGKGLATAEEREIYMSVGKRALSNVLKNDGKISEYAYRLLTIFLPKAVEEEKIVKFYETYIDYLKIKNLLLRKGYKEELEADTTGKATDFVFYKEKNDVSYNIILGVKDKSKTVGYFTNFVCRPEDIGKVDRKTMGEVQDDAIEALFECYKGDQR